jgi:hypothetical protein
MTPKELRIGNLVDLGNRFAKISEIYHEACTVLDLEETQDTIEDYERTKPIPLTKEWLLKFGFMTDDIEWWDGLVSLGIYKDGLFYCPTSSISYRLSKIEYVHQLQNLCFAVTGEELKIKSE